jgi:beta-phosphoglucomutase-like phosphatase (HAD superfamily)
MAVATLFDFDGVLVDSELVHLAAFNDVLAPRGIHIGEEEYTARLLSLDDAGVFRAVLSGAGRAPSDDEVRDLVDAKAPRFMARFATELRSFRGAADLIARRSARGPIGVVSGALRAEIEFALERMGVRRLFAFIVSAEDTEESKPHPAPYQKGVRELEARGHAGVTLAIEDSVGGIASAKGARIRCVAVAHSYAADELLRAGADAIARDLDGLTDALVEGDP